MKRLAEFAELLASVAVAAAVAFVFVTILVSLSR